MWTERVFIIAEAGVNHNGKLEWAMQLIDEAAFAGADAVKFQTFKTEKLVSKSAKMAEYQKNNTGKDHTQMDMLKSLELDEKDHVELQKYCHHKGIIFFSTAFDLDSIDLLKKFNMPVWKIPSGEITNYPYLKKIGALAQKVIVSTGMADLGEVEDCLDVLMSSGTTRENLVILHCNTEYPTPWEDVNLRAMVTLGQAFQLDYGYSDHTEGIEVPIAAVALGARVIEKHFTLDRQLPGPDHKASLEPHELRKMVESIRHIEKAMGNGIKKPSPSESKNKEIARKSIVASRSIQRGEPFSDDNITVKRPGNGINPMLWSFVSGKKASRDFHEDELIEL